MIIQISNSKGENAKERLKIMRTIYDGYTIAERDLQMRGPGDFFSSGSSIRQSGDMGFDIANKCSDNDFAMRAFECARNVLARDARLEAEENKLLRERVNEIYTEKSNTIN